MADIKINLLPWREERREERKKEFLNVLLGIVFIAGGLVLAIDRYYSGEIEGQQARNTYLTEKIAVLEERIQEMLEAKRAVAENLLSAGEGWITELSNDELRDLLTLDRTEAVQ